MKRKDKKVYLVLSDYEYRLLLHCLISFRNKLIAEGHYTDAIDEIILRHWN